jgi:hypothetical protein
LKLCLPSHGHVCAVPIRTYSRVVLCSSKCSTWTQLLEGCVRPCLSLGTHGLPRNDSSTNRFWRAPSKQRDAVPFILSEQIYTRQPSRVQRGAAPRTQLLVKFSPTPKWRIANLSARIILAYSSIFRFPEVVFKINSRSWDAVDC